MFPWEVKLAVAEALYPGELDAILRKNYPIILWSLSKYCQVWVQRLGFNECLSEAHTGALNGLVTWMLRGGPDGLVRDKPQTFIIRGIRYHFSANGFSWWVGPIRVTNKILSAGADVRIQSLSPNRSSDPIPEAERDAFTDDTGPEDAAESRDRADLAAAVAELADAADPSGAYYVALSLRFGLGGVQPANFKAIGDLLCCSKQGAQQIVSRALSVVRESFRGRVPDY